jgi:hypothetical protein
MSGHVRFDKHSFGLTTFVMTHRTLTLVQKTFRSFELVRARFYEIAVKFVDGTFGTRECFSGIAFCNLSV